MATNDAFRRLHHASDVLLRPNGWDFASIASLAAVGFVAIGTTSLGVAAAAGRSDAAGTTRDETVTLARRTSSLCLLSVDIEGGFSEDPGEVAALAVELAELGAVGVNIEDGRPGRRLAEVDRQAALIAAVKQAAPGLFVNARTDTYWLNSPAASVDRTAHRLASYAAAGADGVFVPGAVDSATISELAGVTNLPLNVLYVPGGPSVAQLADLGVRRVSLGSLLFRASLLAVTRTAENVRRGVVEPEPSLPTYDEVEALIARFSPVTGLPATRSSAANS